MFADWTNEAHFHHEFFWDSPLYLQLKVTEVHLPKPHTHCVADTHPGLHLLPFSTCINSSLWIRKGENLPIERTIPVTFCYLATSLSRRVSLSVTSPVKTKDTIVNIWFASLLGQKKVSWHLRKTSSTPIIKQLTRPFVQIAFTECQNLTNKLICLKAHSRGKNS